jgi:PAS domain-containing protein
VVATPDGAILGATPAMEKLLGSQPGRLHGQPLWQFLIPESAGELRVLVAAENRGAALRFPLTFIAAGSSERTLICNLDVQPGAFALLGEPIPAGVKPEAETAI